MSRRRLVLVVTSSTLAAILTGCSAETTGAVTATHAGAAHGGGLRAAALAERPPGGEARTPRGAVEAMFVAYDRKQLDRWLGAWTDDGYQQAFGVTKDEAALVPPSWGDARSFRESQVQLLDVVEHGQHQRPAGATPEHGDGEHVTLLTLEAGVETRHRLDLVRERGVWRVAGRALLPSARTGTVVPVVLVDHAVVLAAPPTTGDLVLRVRNDGSVPHELILLRERGGLDETVGRTGVLDPGEVRDLVSRDLPAGAYALVCNQLDGQGAPHSTLGMRVALELG